MTLEELKKHIFYVPRTGHFYWCHRGKNRAVGRPAGFMSAAGYWRIGVGAKDYMAHRLAWLFCNGKWPDGVIDHINHNRLDNRIVNLRCTDQAGNMRNCIKPRKDNTTGYRGVSKHACGKFTARIQTKGEYKHLGLFERAEDAALAYEAAKIKYHNINMTAMKEVFKSRHTE